MLLLLALRAEVEWREAIDAGNDSSSASSATSSPISACRREQRLQLVQLCLGRVVAREPGGAFELVDERIERAVLVMRRAEIAQAGMRLGFDAARTAPR